MGDLYGCSESRFSAEREGAHAFCLRFFGASAPQYDTPVISNESERSHAIRSFGRDSSLHYVSFRMTVMSSQTYVRDLIQNTHPLGLGISCRGTEKETGRGQKLL